VNPATVHTIAAVGDAGAAVVDRLSSSTPEDGVKADDTSGPVRAVNEVNIITVEMLRLEHSAVAELLLKEMKRKPVMETVLKAAPAGSANATVNVTFRLKFKGGAWVACWLRISASLKARSYTARNFMRPLKFGSPGQWLFPM
jgi:hypothetical protein